VSAAVDGEETVHTWAEPVVLIEMIDEKTHELI
jgi:hypothetical protein